SQLERVTAPKGEYLSAKITTKGRSAAEILSEMLPKEIASIYWPKNMYWRKTNERFVRPVRWLVAMLDDTVIPLEFGGRAMFTPKRCARRKSLIGKSATNRFAKLSTPQRARFREHAGAKTNL